jgi:hypothetical protein
MRMVRPLIWFVVLALVAAAPPAFARFERLVDPNCSDESDCAYWRPVLAAFPGWHLEDEAGRLLLGHALVPDGSTYDNAKTVIYVRAVEKTRVEGEANTIADYIAIDRDDIIRNWPGTIVAAAPPLKSGFGRRLKTQTFTPIAGAQNRYERTAYDKQGRFFVRFTLSADSQAGLAASMQDFERLIAAYKIKP